MTQILSNKVVEALESDAELSPELTRSTLTFSKVTRPLP